MSLHPKVAGSVLAMALAGIIIAELARRGIEIEAGEAANITTVVGFVAAWLTPSERVPPL